VLATLAHSSSAGVSQRAPCAVTSRPPRSVAIGPPHPPNPALQDPGRPPVQEQAEYSAPRPRPPTSRSGCRKPEPTSGPTISASPPQPLAPSRGCSSACAPDPNFPRC
jgi:hypothetical protein